MILITDIGGHTMQEMNGILVSDKFRREAVEAAEIKPSCIIDSISRIQDVIR